MKIRVENRGPSRNFYDLREELIDEGKKFDEATLRVLPYDQLQLCCMGNAGDAACTPRQVAEEKAFRRERFLALEEDEFKDCERFLRTEGMYDDVMFEIAARNAPRWDDLNDRQKVWAKLNCIYNHVGNPESRIEDTIVGFQKCGTTCLPEDVCKHYIQKLKSLLTVYPGGITDDFFRTQIEDIRDTIRDFLPDDEQMVCQRQQIRDFSCTSDCFKVLV